LRPPLRADAVTRHAPHLLGVGPEESEVQLPPEAIDEELLQRPLRADREEGTAEVAQTDAQRAEEPQLAEGVETQGHRVVEEAPAVIDAGAAPPQEEH